MEKVLNVISWIKENWDNVLAVYGAVVVVATTIVRWTPSTKDDGVVDKVIKFLDNFSTVFTKKDKEKLK